MMNCRSLTVSSSMKTLRPALPSILVMASITMFVLAMPVHTEQVEVLLHRLQEGWHLHRASAYHVVDLYHLVEPPDLFAVVEVTQVPSDPFVNLLICEL